MRWLEQVDPEVAKAIRLETERQSRNLELIASENFVSEAVLEAVGSVMTNKYAEGYPGRRYYGGCSEVDKAEEIAIERAKELFGADHANVQAHSGASANQAVYGAFMQPGDTFLAMSLPMGGHLTHGSKVSFSGKWFNAVGYGVDKQTEDIDYDQVEALVRKAADRFGGLLADESDADGGAEETERAGNIASDFSEDGSHDVVDLALVAISAVRTLGTLPTGKKN